MGRDKAALPYGGSTFLQTLIDRYAQCIGPVAVSVDRTGRFPFTGAAELPDPYPGQGPLNGILAAFTQTNAEEIFLTATDIPHGDPSLALTLSALRGDADACVPRRGVKGREPLFAIYGRSCLEACLALMERGGRSFAELFAILRVRSVRPEELPEFSWEHILTNVNTPAEYGKIIEEDTGICLKKCK